MTDGSQLKSIDDLKPAPYNPRKISAKAAAGLAKSLGDFGDLSGIVWNKRTGNLVCGHQRVDQLRKLGGQLLNGAVQVASGERFLVRVVDWPVGKEKAANVVANNPSIGGEFTDGLDELLGEIKLDIGEDSFGELALDELLNPSAADVLDDSDDAPELPVDPVSKIGDVWVLGSHRLVCGDSTDGAVVAACLGGAKPGIMITDPPYGIEYNANWRNDALHAGRGAMGGNGGRAVGKVLNDDNADWRDTWAHFTGDVAYVWHDWKRSSIVLESLAVTGLLPRAQIIWAKNSHVISRGHYHGQHETCFYVVRDGATANWIGDRSQTTLWQIDRPRKSETGHSTQKPVECMARPMRNHAGDIYEPFAGSGTTIVAAEQLGRRCYAIELNPAYCDVIVKRWEQLTGQQAKRIPDGSKA